MIQSRGVRVGAAASIVVAATTTAIWTIGPGKLAVVKKIWWTNRTAGNAVLSIGYTNNVAGWVQVFIDMLMLTAVADGYEDLPIFGNTPQGFFLDATVGAGCTGVIAVRSSVAGAAPANVQVQVEIEEI